LNGYLNRRGRCTEILFRRKIKVYTPNNKCPMSKTTKKNTARIKDTRAKDGAGRSVFQFKITLNDSSPNVWRRILVPAEYTFFDLHVAIQNAMGWYDGHLHSFDIAQKGTARPLSIRFPDPENDSFYGETFPDERVEKIADYFGASIKQCIYTYDFGDGWDHTILFERKLPKESSAVYPQCTAGANACPPENCGGVPGYKRLQRILKNPRDPDFQDMMNWLCLDTPADFDPLLFDVGEVAFEDQRKRLKEYEKGFGVKPLKKK